MASIVSDRDSIFLGTFWQSLFSIHGTDFLLSSAYHPATDGQTEVVNRCLENYLRCMCSNNEKDWSSWLSISEWWYNTHFHTAIKMTPYEVVYGQPPPLHLPYLPGEDMNDEVDRSLQRREQILSDLNGHLTKAHQRMKSQADKHRSDRNFAVNDWVWLKLQPYRQQSMHYRANHKLSAKFYGPFQIIAKIGKVAYKLKLPSSVGIHDVFHVSQLKPFHSAFPLTVTLPTMRKSATELRVPQAILERRVQKVHNSVEV